MPPSGDSVARRIGAKGRVAVRLTADEAQRRFLGSPIARLATIAEDGAPRVVPVVFALVDDALVHVVDHKPKSTPDLARLRDVAAEPRVALLVDAYDADWTRLWWARADAVAEVVTGGPTWRRAVAALQQRYVQYREVPPTGPVVRAVVRRWSGWSASKG